MYNHFGTGTQQASIGRGAKGRRVRGGAEVKRHGTISANGF